MTREEILDKIILESSKIDYNKVHCRNIIQTTKSVLRKYIRSTASHRCTCEMPVWTIEDMIQCARCKGLLPGVNKQGVQ